MPEHATLPLWADANDAQRIDKLRRLVDDLYAAAHGQAVSRVIATLESHRGEDDKERADARFIVALCRQHPNILWQTCEVGHITGSSLIIDAGATRVLLNHHRKFDRWMQFGGHAEHELEPWRVALREAGEETGLIDLRFVPQQDDPAPFDVDVHQVPARDARPEHYHLDLRYLLATGEPDRARATHESHAIGWFTIEQAMGMDLEPTVHRMIRKAVASVRIGAARGQGNSR